MAGLLSPIDFKTSHLDASSSNEYCNLMGSFATCTVRGIISSFKKCLLRSLTNLIVIFIGYPQHVKLVSGRAVFN